MRKFTLVLGLALVLLSGPATPKSPEEENLVANGSFEEGRSRRAPDGWQAAGSREIRQELGVDRGRDGKRAARLVCSDFEGAAPDSHAMVCQVGEIALRRGQWYRFSFAAKAEGIRRGSVDVALVDTGAWRNAGLSEVVNPGVDWREYEFRFRAKIDLPAATSRLQFWFKSTGTLWLDDVRLVPTEEGEERLPSLPTEGDGNLLPNASFECGKAAWGGYTWGLPGWSGGLWRLEGELDRQVAFHGPTSLRLAVTAGKEPVYSFDYYEPARVPVRRILAANRGWFRAEPGETFTLSAHLLADREGVRATLVVVDPDGRVTPKTVTPGTKWGREELTFSARGRHFFVAVGIDLTDAPVDSGILWVDAVSLTRGEEAPEFAPRRPLEAFLSPEAEDGIFPPDEGLTIRLTAYNDGDSGTGVDGEIRITDFFDRLVKRSAFVVPVSAHSGVMDRFDGLLPGRRGFFRAQLVHGEERQSIRLAALDPVPPGDSPFGMNHAFPWDPLVRSAVRAGVLWWRDWTAKWDTVEPAEGSLDFAKPDDQIGRVLESGGRPLVLLPFPASRWSTTADPAAVEKAAGGNAYLRARLPMAFPPKDPEAFGRYAAATASHYAPRDVHTVEILNEPVYTTYALPRKFGCTIEDYLDLLEIAADAVRGACPDARVVGGMGAHPESEVTREFLDRRGSSLVDVVDVHLYDAPRAADSYAETFRDLGDRMKRHGGKKPIWITEYGCYADDDPAVLPHSVGDATMNRCRWPSEREAAEHVVKFAAVAASEGVEKIFFHAGTSPAVNFPDAGGVLFEHGGAPRRIVPALAAYARIVGTPEAFLRREKRSGVIRLTFRSRGRTVTVAFATDGAVHRIPLRRGEEALDVMGNPLPVSRVVVGGAPVYLVRE